LLLRTAKPLSLPTPFVGGYLASPSPGSGMRGRSRDHRGKPFRPDQHVLVPDMLASTYNFLVDRLSALSAGTHLRRSRPGLPRQSCEYAHPEGAVQRRASKPQLTSQSTPFGTPR
jgi:hypothetical protein